MNCPYCGEEIDGRRASCRLCGADLTLIIPLVATIERLTKRIEFLENGVEGPGAPLGAPPAESTKALPAWLHIPNISDELAVILALLGLAFAHVAVVVLLDASLTYLLAAAIVLPLGAGFLRRDERDHPVLRAIWWAFVLAVAALAEMSLVTWSLWRIPIIPQDAHDWQQLIHYGGAIAASFIIGALARGLIRFWYVGRGRVWSGRRSGILYRTLRSVAKLDAEAIERSEKLVRQLEYTVMNLTALVASVFFLLDHLQPALSWLKAVKGSS
jgi:hypothetical protein